MKKIIFVLPELLILTSCVSNGNVKGTKNVEHWAYVHQVIEQTDNEKIALANVGRIDYNGNKVDVIRSVKLILKNCQYEDDWIDGKYYIWPGNLENTHKAFSFTTAAGAQRTIPVYSGDCKIQEKVECWKFEQGCIIEDKEIKEN